MSIEKPRNAANLLVKFQKIQALYKQLLEIDPQVAQCLLNRRSEYLQAGVALGVPANSLADAGCKQVLVDLIINIKNDVFIEPNPQYADIVSQCLDDTLREMRMTFDQLAPVASGRVAIWIARGIVGAMSLLLADYAIFQGEHLSRMTGGAFPHCQESVVKLLQERRACVPMKK